MELLKRPLVSQALHWAGTGRQTQQEQRSLFQGSWLLRSESAEVREDEDTETPARGFSVGTGALSRSLKCFISLTHSYFYYFYFIKIKLAVFFFKLAVLKYVLLFLGGLFPF